MRLIQYSAVIVFCGVLLMPTGGYGQSPKTPAVDQVPKEYQGKKMPKGWWTDPKVIEEGRKIYEGMVHADVKCATCHGKDGKPRAKGARDLRDAAYVDKMPESYWFWRESEGVPPTPETKDNEMKAWKKYLTEEQRWKVIAYQHTFSHGEPAEHDHK